MEQQKVDMYLAVNAKYFESHLIPQIYDMLGKVDDSKFMMIQTVNLRDPTTMLKKEKNYENSRLFNNFLLI